MINLVQIEMEVLVLIITTIGIYLFSLHLDLLCLQTLHLVISLLSLMMGLCILLLLRLYLMGSHIPAFATADNPTARSPWVLTRLFTFLYLPVFNLHLLVFPRWLSFDWSMDAIPRVTTLADSRNILVGLVYYTLYKSARIAIRKVCDKRNLINSDNFNNVKNLNRAYCKVRSCSSCKHNLSEHHSLVCRTNNNNNHVSRCECRQAYQLLRVQPLDTPRTTSETFLICVLFLVIPFLPATNALFYVGFVVAERVLYLPSVGYCFLVAFGGHLISKRSNRRVVRAVFLLLLVAFSGRTIRRNRDWMDEESLYRSGIAVNPPKGIKQSIN